MADISQEELTQAPANIGAGSMFKTAESITQQHDNLKSQEQAGFGEKWDAFYDQAMQVNTLEKVVGWADESFGREWKPEEGFEMDDTSALGVLDGHGLNIKYFKEIRNSKSSEEQMFRVLQAKRDQKTEEEITKSLGETGRTFASIAGGIADIDLVAGLGVGLLTKSSTLAKVMMYDGITETSLVATRFMVNKDYSLEDAVFDMSIGLAITAGANKLVHTFKQPAVGVPKNEDAMDVSNYKWSAEEFPTTGKRADAETRQATADVMNSGKAKPRKASTVAEEVEVKKQTKGTPEYEAEVTRLKEVRSTIHRKAGLSEAKVKELEARQLKQEKAGMTPEQIRNMNDGKPVKGVPDSTIKMINVIEDMSKDVNKLSDSVYRVIKEAPQEDIAQLKDVIDDLIAESPKEMAAVKRLMNSKLGNQKFDKILKSIEDLDLKPKNKKKLMAATVVLGATAAQAGDDENIAGELTGLFILAGVVAIGAPSAIKKIRNANVREQIKSIQGKLENAYHKAEVNSSPQAGMIRKVGRVIADSAHTRITSTVAPYLKEGGDAKKVMDDLVYSAENGAGAETTKAMWAHGTMFKYARAENKAYKAWKAERDITLTSNLLDDMNAVHRFREEVMDNMEMRNSKSMAVKELTAENDKIMAEIWDKAKEYEVFGFEKINYKAGMMPRLWKSGELNVLVNKISDGDQLLMRDSIANAIAKTSGDLNSATDIADRYMDSWGKGFDATMDVNRAEDVFGSLGNLLKDDIDFDDFADAMKVTKDRNSRAKFRVDFDVNDIEPIKVNIDGVDTLITKAHFLERDYKTVLDRVANSMYGSAAIAKRGYKSRAHLDSAIVRIQNPTMRKEMNQVADLVMGVPVPSNNKFLHDISMIVKDLTMVAKLPFVVFSMPPELIATLGNSGFTKGSRAVYNAVLSTFGKDSAMMGSLTEVTGLGTGFQRLDTSGYRGLTDNITELDDAGLTSKVREGTMKLRDWSMMANGLSYFSDVLQRSNLQLNAEKFANFVVHGKEGGAGINKSRLRSFGIDESSIKMFEDTFEFNSKGHLKNYDMSKWSTKKRDKFGEILRDMNQAVSPETTIGETGLYTRTTDLGRALSSLVSYPMQQFNIHGLEDLKHFDRMTFMHSVGGFAGAYIGLQARYGVQNKEVDDEMLLMYALLNVPQFGGFSAITSMASPASLDTVQSALNIVGMDKH